MNFQIINDKCKHCEAAGRAHELVDYMAKIIYLKEWTKNSNFLFDQFGSKKKMLLYGILFATVARKTYKSRLQIVSRQIQLIL